MKSFFFFLMPFCKFHFFRRIFHQDVLVEEGAVPAVAVGRVRPKGAQRQHLGTSLQTCPRNLRGMLMIKASHPRRTEEMLPWQQEAYVDLSVIPLFPCQIAWATFSSSTPKLRCDTEHIKSNPLILALGWQETNSSITFCHSGLWYHHQYAVLEKHLPTVS